MSILLSKKSLVDLNPFALIKLISSIFSSEFKSTLSCTLWVFLYFFTTNEMVVKNGGKKEKSPL